MNWWYPLGSSKHLVWIRGIVYNVVKKLNCDRNFHFLKFLVKTKYFVKLNLYSKDNTSNNLFSSPTNAIMYRKLKPYP